MQKSGGINPLILTVGCNWKFGLQSLYSQAKGPPVSFTWGVCVQAGAEETHVFQMASTRREPADSSDNAVSVAMEHWNVEHRVFAIDQFLFYKQWFRSYCPTYFPSKVQCWASRSGKKGVIWLTLFSVRNLVRKNALKYLLFCVIKTFYVKNKQSYSYMKNMRFLYSILYNLKL